MSVPDRVLDGVTSASRVLARGPIGPRELTTYTHLVTGRGHVR